MTTLAYRSIVIIDTRVYRYREARAFEQELHSTAFSRPTSSLEHRFDPGPATLSVAEGFLVGRLDVPRLSVSAMVREGSTKRRWNACVGHFAATALPGQSGNVALAGHRDTISSARFDTSAQ